MYVLPWPALATVTSSDQFYSFATARSGHSLQFTVLVKTAVAWSYVLGTEQSLCAISLFSLTCLTFTDMHFLLHSETEDSSQPELSILSKHSKRDMMEFARKSRMEKVRLYTLCTVSSIWDVEYFCSCIEEVSVGVNCVMVRGCLLTLVPKSVYVACLSKLCLCVRVCECDWMCVSVDVCVCSYFLVSFWLPFLGKWVYPEQCCPIMFFLKGNLYLLYVHLTTCIHLSLL